MRRIAANVAVWTILTENWRLLTSKPARQTTRSATAAALQRDAALRVAESTDLLWLDWRELTDYW